MSRIELPWGEDTLPVDLPDSWRVLGELSPMDEPEPDDPADACARALALPIGAVRLKDRDLSGASVVLVVDDHSRPTPVADFIKPVISEIQAAGVEEHHIDVLAATGVHRASTPEELEQKLGPDVFAGIRWRCHNAYDPDELADLGTTSRGTRVFVNRLLTRADLIVCLGSIEPHLLLGFGGGLKMIIPGCAGARTIGRNHMQGVDPDHFDFVGAEAKDSPMRLDLEEGAAMLGRDIFVVNAAMSPRGRPVRFFCGDPVKAHREGERYIRERAGLRVTEQADVVLTNSHPMDADLRQSVKCVGNTLYAARPGGIMLGCLKCDNGLGEMPIPKKTLPYGALRLLLKIIGKKRVLPLVRRIKKGEPVEEVFIGHFGLQMLLRNHLGMFSDSPRLPGDIGRKMGMLMSFTQVQQMVDWAAARAPREASVWVFPHGGSSFAVID